jgi:hypothetical protein
MTMSMVMQVLHHQGAGWYVFGTPKGVYWDSRQTIPSCQGSEIVQFLASEQ